MLEIVRSCHFFLKLHTHFKNIKMGGEESIAYKKVKVKITQLCPTLYEPMDYTVHGILTPVFWSGVGSCSLLWGIFPTQGSNPSLPHCRRILYQLSHQGSIAYKRKILF